LLLLLLLLILPVVPPTGLRRHAIPAPPLSSAQTYTGTTIVTKAS